MNSTLLGGLIEIFAHCLTTDAARKIVALRAEDALQRHVDELADKANRGVLSDDERAEYDRYLAAAHFVTVMQTKARKMLQAQ
jgi:hypothetical protein